MPTEVSKCTYLYEPNEYIIREGDEHNGNVFILQSGVLKVVKNGVVFTKISEQQSIFGEMSVILNCKRTTTVIAETKSMVVKLPFDIEVAYKTHPRLAHVLTTGLAQRLRDMNSAYEEVCARNTRLSEEIAELRKSAM